MPTFEKVLEVFAEYLAQDKDYEVVLTKHGYTVMGFDDRMKDWATIEYCATPEALRDALLDACENFLEMEILKNRRPVDTENLTKEEDACIQAKLKRLAEEC